MDSGAQSVKTCYQWTFIYKDNLVLLPIHMSLHGHRPSPTESVLAEFRLPTTGPSSVTSDFSPWDTLFLRPIFYPVLVAVWAN